MKIFVDIVRYLSVVVLLMACGAPHLALDPPPYRAEGQLVLYEHNIGLAGHMASTWRGGMPIIYWHPDRMYLLSPVMKRFILAHEYCHLENRGLFNTEILADCCGLALVYGSGLDGDEVLSEIVSEVSDWPGSDVHPPGSFRVLGLMACAIAIGD